jgi:hypothetical protein
MDWIAQIVNDFGKHIGLPELAIDDNGRLRMSLEDGTGMGLLRLSALPNPEIVVYRSYPLAYLNAPSFRAALRLADFRQPNAWTIQAGISQRDVMLAMRIPERAFSTSSLEHALSRLAELFNSIR